MKTKTTIDGIVYEEVTEGNYFIYPEKGNFIDDFDKPYQIRVVREDDDSWRTGLQYDDEYIPENLPDYVKEVKKRFKGRGKTERPVCPQCGEDLKRSYETAENWKKGKTPYGWHCRTCKYQQWD